MTSFARHWSSLFDLPGLSISLQRGYATLITDDGVWTVRHIEGKRYRAQGPGVDCTGKAKTCARKIAEAARLLACRDDTA